MNYEKARAYNRARTLAPAALHALREAIGRDVSAWTDADLMAIAQWQALQGLEADGMVGPKTVEAVFALVTSQGIVPNFMHEAAAKFPGHRFGIDVSRWQPDLDVSKMQGVSFCILKATEASSTDPLFLRHRGTFSGCMPLGSYHLPHMASGAWGAETVAEVERQARYAGAVAKGNPVELFNWLDFEPDDDVKKEKPPRFFEALLMAFKGNRAKAAAWVKRWRDVFEDVAEVECGSYISPKIAGLGGDELREVLAPRPLWIASYRQQPKLPTPRVPKMPEAWGDRWDLWQMRGSDDKKTKDIDEGGRCLGVMGGLKSCDQNVMNPASPLMRLLGGVA
jgi:GH25 family lysozyme M1 (1,4-beta-N-acetylmuramidase)